MEICIYKGIRKKEKAEAGKRAGTALCDEEGMMTIEVSVILPALCLFIAGTVFFVLFLLDMAVVKSETQRIANEAAAVWKTEGKLAGGDYVFERLEQRPWAKLMTRNNENLMNQARKRLRTRIMERTCLVKSVNAEVRIRGNYVYGICQLHFAIPLSQAAEYFLRDSWSYHCRSRAHIDDIQEKLRASFVMNRRKKGNGE